MYGRIIPALLLLVLLLSLPGCLGGGGDTLPDGEPEPELELISFDDVSTAVLPAEPVPAPTAMATAEPVPVLEPTLTPVVSTQVPTAAPDNAGIFITPLDDSGFSVSDLPDSFPTALPEVAAPRLWPGAPGGGHVDTDAFDFAFWSHYGVNPPVSVESDRISRFGFDVDTRSYDLVLRWISEGVITDPGEIRAEEIINGVDYRYSGPMRRTGAAGEPAFAVHIHASPAPAFFDGAYLVRVGIQGDRLPVPGHAPLSLILVVDGSGSMVSGGSIDLLSRSIDELVELLNPEDRLGLVFYGELPRVVVYPGDSFDAESIRQLLGSLIGSGSGYAEDGLELAYALAEGEAMPGRDVRVVLFSDGVGNLGPLGSARSAELVSGSEARDGIVFSGVTLGDPRTHDRRLAALVSSGSGYWYRVGSVRGMRRSFEEQVSWTSRTLAEDVSVSVEFVAGAVRSYRLVGFESRFNDRGEVVDEPLAMDFAGYGHSVTAIYEVHLARSPVGTLVWASVGYREVGSGESRVVTAKLKGSDIASEFSVAPLDFRLAVLAAGVGEKLQGSYWREFVSYEELLTGLMEVRLVGLADERLLRIAQWLVDREPD